MTFLLKGQFGFAAGGGSLGAGYTFLSYSQNNSPISFEQHVFTVTGSLGATVAQGLLKFSLGGYLNAAVLDAEVTGATDPSRFFGVNARMGVRVFRSMKQEEFTIHLGAYYWGSINPQYGVKRALGESYTFEWAKPFSSGRSRGRGYRMYVKYAPLEQMESSFFSFSRIKYNRELAIGLGYELFSQTLIGLDFSMLNFRREDLDLNVRLNTLSLGFTFLF